MTGLLPRTLDIYLTSRCNLECAYCSSKGITAKDLALPLASVLKAVDLYVSRLGPGSRDAAVNFTGGEPLLAYDTLRDSILRIRRRYPRLRLTAMTNGVLLSPDRAAFLLEQRVMLTVSLDGEKRPNDSFRKFRRPRASSSYDAVTSRLGRLTPEQIAAMSAGVTVTRKTLAAMPQTLSCLRRLGFRLLCLNFDMFEPWTGEGLERLAASLKVLRSSSGRQPRDLFFETVAGCDRLSQLTRVLVFSPDGRFFPCHAACKIGRAHV